MALGFAGAVATAARSATGRTGVEGPTKSIHPEHGARSTWGDVGGPVASVAVGPANTCAVRQDGALFCWGRNTSGQLAGAVNVDASLVPVQIPIPVSGVHGVRVGYSRGRVRER